MSGADRTLSLARGQAPPDSAFPQLRSAFLLAPVALLLALRRAMLAERFAALGARARPSRTVTDR